MSLPFRQVNLDFHTSEYVPGIGSAFSKEQFQQMLKLGCVNSITLFSKCHHGWSYHPTQTNEMHPNLEVDLLSAQIEAAHEIGVKTPVYLSVGYDEKEAKRHPEWRALLKDEEGEYIFDPLRPYYHHMCLNTPYLERVLEQIREVCQKYDLDSLFLDIVGERECYCPHCLQTMIDRGWNPEDPETAKKLGQDVYANYTRRVREVVDSVKPGLEVFHNGGHIIAGRRDLANMDSHLEIESLPTGGWGYDHFPMSVAYCRNLGMDYLGMTGKFHTTWGEFGGYKHKNALRYEAALSIANGAKCSVGDQLHPNGEMSEATYRLIGAAYSEVEKKEPWCDNVTPITDVGVLSVEAFTKERNHPDNIATVGVTRMLLEGHYLFDILDEESELDRYKVLILPDVIPMSETLRRKLDRFVSGGGKLLASGDSAVDRSSGNMLFDLGCTYIKTSDYCPAYVKPMVPLKNMPQASYVIYEPGNTVLPKADALELAQREQSYFNRDITHFCSHLHTPNSGVIEGSAATIGADGAYFSWKLFKEYATKGSLILRDLFCAAMDWLLWEKKTFDSNLPAQGVATVMDQTEEQRLVNHLLYVSPVKRGDGIEIIEDIVPLYNIRVKLRTERTVKRVYLAPQQEDLKFEQSGSVISYTINCLENHQMVVLDYEESDIFR